MTKSTDILAEFDPINDIEHADLGDSRRTERFVNIVDTLIQRPDRTVPETFGDEAKQEGYYRFIRSPHVEADSLFLPHFQASSRRAESVGHVLCHHDTTEFAWPVHDDQMRENLARPSTNRQGFLWHASMLTAADGTRAPLGLVGGKDFVHQTDLKSSESRAYWQGRDGIYQNEKWRWFDAILAAESHLSKVDRVTHVMDREFDDFQMLYCMDIDGYDYVARARYDRKVSTGPRRKDYQRLHEALSESKWRGRRTIELSARSIADADPAHPARRRRKARVRSRQARVELRRPDSVPAKSADDRLTVSVVEVCEIKPPSDQEPVRWLLLTPRPLETLAEVWEIVDWYRARWSIEEFFKAIKTGCGYTKLQHRSAKTLLSALAATALVAHFLLVLRHLGRHAADLPAKAVASRVQIEVLKAVKPKFLSRKPTAGEIMAAVASLGGHRRSNGPPGWQILGRGWQRLLEYEHAFALGMQAQKEM